MPLRALLERDDIPEDARAAIRDVLSMPSDDSTTEQTLWRQRELAHDLIGADSVEAALNLCLRAALDLTGFEAGGIYVAEEHTGDFVMICHTGLSAGFVAGTGRAPGDSPRGRRVRSGRSVYWSNQEPGAIAGDDERAEGLLAVAGVPVFGQDEVMAWVNVASRKFERLPPGAMDLLESVSGLLGVALHRLRTEKALQDSEERYRALVESATDAIFAVDADGGILAVNSAAARLLGAGSDEVVGRSLRDIFPPQEAERRIGIMRRIYETKTGATATYQEPYRGVGLRWFNATLSPVFDGSGEVTCVLGIARDITEHVEAEAALRASEEQYRTLVEAAPDAIMTVDPDGRILSVNAAMARRLDRPSESLIGMRLSDLMPEESVCRRLGWIRQAMETGEPVTARDRGSVAGHEETWYEAIHAPVRDAEGNVRHVLVVSRDVTEQVRATEALRRSDERYAMATAAGKVAVWDIDTETDRLYDSPSLAEMLGYSPGEVPCDWRELERLRHPDDRLRVAEISKSIADGQTTEFVIEQRLLHKDGQYRSILSRGSAVRDDEGRLTRVIGTNTDITEQKRAEEERSAMAARLQQAQRLESLGVLAGGVAHDFSNLLTGLLGNLSLARRRLHQASPAQPYLQRAESAASQAAELAESMLAYSGQGLIELAPVDLAELLTDTVDMAATALPEGVTLVPELPADLPPIQGEAAQLRAVVQNLIRNAAEAIGETTGTITVGADVIAADRPRLAQTYVDDDLPEGRYLCLRVSDTGSGMDAQVLARVFDPFFSTKSYGRGLGLPSSLGVVRAHRGAIQVHSEPGRGATFEVLLPIAPEAVGAPELGAPPPSPPDDPCTGAVLLAEDEALVRAVAAAALEEAGFTVLQAADGSEALHLFQEHPDEIRAVLLDLAMPHADGMKVLGEVRRQRPGLPVIVASAYNGDDAVARLRESGPARFIRKPYRPEELVAGLREILST